MQFPDYLKKYSGSLDANGDVADTTESLATKNRRLRTFSETLKMLDDDIVAELNVN
jgi:hypothetical protein